MPSKKKKYNARFPPGRIKKIMQTDEEVGKVAQAVPIIISRTLELFVHSLLTKTMQITSAKQAKTLSPSHMKQCILSESRFDFLKDLVKNLPDVSGPDDEVIHTPPTTPATQAVSVNTTVPSFAPVAQSNTGASTVSKDGSSCTHVPPRRHSVDKGDKTKLAKPIEGNETVFTYNVPKFKMSVPTSFNASQPNFYTEVNSNPSDSMSRNNSVSQPVSNFACTGNIDEDYDT
ncbi:PREDICTED: DNA polymerase epsilon subunit C [Ceratosolen solmsi marchali]|uniref:DNA polymerase epsilon subunit C n=1 Tax=Ceratosolen solmsi marchali TaxID=326594 RepID=A0AAJ7DVC4_9HYME|nr:PREDICTED: DNA polymerase epsilon subunit C [Ceratosolen solmsi marchali]